MVSRWKVEFRLLVHDWLSTGLGFPLTSTLASISWESLNLQNCMWGMYISEERTKDLDWSYLERSRIKQWIKLKKY